MKNKYNEILNYIEELYYLEPFQYSLDNKPNISDLVVFVDSEDLINYFIVLDTKDSKALCLCENEKLNFSYDILYDLNKLLNNQNISLFNGKLKYHKTLIKKSKPSHALTS